MLSKDSFGFGRTHLPVKMGNYKKHRAFPKPNAVDHCYLNHVNKPLFITHMRHSPVHGGCREAIQGLLTRVELTGGRWTGWGVLKTLSHWTQYVPREQCFGQGVISLCQQVCWSDKLFSFFCSGAHANLGEL